MYFKYFKLTCVWFHFNSFYCHLVGYKQMSYCSTTQNWPDKVDCLLFEEKTRCALAPYFKKKSEDYRWFSPSWSQGPIYYNDIICCTHIFSFLDILIYEKFSHAHLPPPQPSKILCYSKHDGMHWSYNTEKHWVTIYQQVSTFNNNFLICDKCRMVLHYSPGTMCQIWSFLNWRCIMADKYFC